MKTILLTTFDGESVDSKGVYQVEKNFNPREEWIKYGATFGVSYGTMAHMDIDDFKLAEYVAMKRIGVFQQPSCLSKEYDELMEEAIKVNTDFIKWMEDKEVIQPIEYDIVCLSEE